jgi:hypothetical protein
MTSNFADQTALELALYSAARDALANVPTGARLTKHQAELQMILAAFTPDCPHDPEDGVHNHDVVSEPYPRVIGNVVHTFVWRRCTCGLAEGGEYPSR